MKDLQKKHKIWCDKNFGGREIKISRYSINDTISLAGAVGGLAHTTLKAGQGIRGSLDVHKETQSKLMGFISTVALAVFPIRHPYHSDELFVDASSLSILGAIEEIGELCDAESIEDKTDAVGDIVLYLLDYCNKTGIDFEDAVRTTAEKVHKRDWVKNPVNGEVEGE